MVSQSAAAQGTGRSVAVFALLDTASLWQYGGPATNTSAPLLVGQAVQLDAPAPPVTGLPLRQPQGAQPLQLGTRPRGFWNGAVRRGHSSCRGGPNCLHVPRGLQTVSSLTLSSRAVLGVICVHCQVQHHVGAVCTQAVLSGGQLYLATSTLVSDKSSPSYSRRPAISWAQLSVSTATQGTDTCSQSRAGVASRQAWDFSRDFSTGWGHAVSSRTPNQDSTCLPWCSMMPAASVITLQRGCPNNWMSST